jgi:hypothetical protein
MSIRSTYITTTAAVLLAAASLGAAADDKPMHKMGHDAMMSHMVETAKTAQDHEAIALRFDSEAAEFDEKAAQHEALAKQYRLGAGVGPKGNPAALASHCGNLVKNLKASATDAREMARLHREAAKSIKP